MSTVSKKIAIKPKMEAAAAGGASAAVPPAAAVRPPTPPLIASRIDRERRIRVAEGTADVHKLAVNYVSDKHAPLRPLCYMLPESQRGWAWESGDKRRAKQAKFIDSVMHNYPIQGIILNQVEGYYQIYDGRHRIQTLKEYRNNEFRWPVVGGAFYRELSPEDQEKFDARLIPVTITEGATAEQLADIFIRLNSGKRLTESDMYWAYREKPLMKVVQEKIIDNKRLKAALGDPSMNTRTYLANWVALAVGLATKCAGNMTNSYIRNFELTGLECSAEQAKQIEDGVSKFCDLLERANEETSLDLTNKKEQQMAKDLRKVGKVAAFFFHELMGVDEEEGAAQEVMDKYVNVITRLRHEKPEVREAMEDALTTQGAQNLNLARVKKVVKKITEHLEKNRHFENEGDEEEDDE
jgi:hypothetical protein